MSAVGHWNWLFREAEESPSLEVPKTQPGIVLWKPVLADPGLSRGVD